MYLMPYELVYVSPRYKRRVTVPKGYESDGASGPAIDIWTKAWWVHDLLCERACWDDGTPCTGWQAANVLRDILLAEGRWIRAHTWFVATWVFGCKRAAQNGFWPWSRPE